MARRVFSLFLVSVLVAAFVFPVSAGNTVGEVQKDLNFVGFSVGNNGTFPTYFAIDGTVKKTASLSDLKTGTQTIYFYWDWPYLVDEVTISATYMIAGDYRIVSATWYGASMTGWNSCSLTNLGSAVMASGKHDDTSTQNSVYQKIAPGPYMYLVLAVTPDSSGFNTLHRSQSFSSSGTVSQSGSVVRGAINSDVNIVTTTTSLDSRYPWRYAPFVVVPTTAENSNYSYIHAYGGVTIAKAQIRLPQQTMSLSSSGSVSETIKANSDTDIMAAAFASVTYGDDDGLVDTVKHMDKTLDTVSGNMQQIVDNMQKQDDTAADIGTAAGDQTISNTGETLSGGVQSLDQSLDTAGDVASFASGAAMYTNLLTATVGPMLNFGNGVLYWALFAVIVLSVLLFILRRLDG